MAKKTGRIIGCSNGVASVTGERSNPVDPILPCAAKPVHVLKPTNTVRGVVDMTAITAVAAT